jgi:hypothetical protein
MVQENHSRRLKRPKGRGAHWKMAAGLTATRL